MYLFQICDELTLKIFSYLDFYNLCDVSQVCRVWNQISSDDALWNFQIDCHFIGKFFFSHQSSSNDLLKKNQFKQLYVRSIQNKKKWSSEMDHSFFRAFDGDLTHVKYELFCSMEFILIYEPETSEYKIFNKNGKEVKTVEEIPFSARKYFQLVLKQSRQLQNSFDPSEKIIEGYRFKIKDDMIDIKSIDNLQKIQLKHDDIYSDENYTDNIKVRNCLVLVPKSHFLITSASRNPNYDETEISTIIYIWDLAKKQCIKKIHNIDVLNGISFLCLRDEYLFIAHKNGIQILNLQGKTIQFINCNEASSVNPRDGKIFSVQVTEEEIFALDTKGYIHILESKKEIKPIEKKVNEFYQFRNSFFHLRQ